MTMKNIQCGVVRNAGADGGAGVTECVAEGDMWPKT